ncbi:MAG: SGNH/GDSL hydrolase family protein [Ruminococcaceae bacterium]|nr:SGNH/GDSL hydrolase family protein [Oscillospiraceae bacterium]
MRGMEKKRNRLIVFLLILSLVAVQIVTGCNKKNEDLYQFVVTSTTKSETSEESETEAAEPTDTRPAETTESETTESETTESETTEAETTTKAEAKQETKKATTKATTKKATKAPTKKAAKTTTKKKKATPTPTKKPTTKPKYTQYLFVGDSRTVGLDEAVDGISSIAKVGAKVTYLQSVMSDVTKTRGKNVIFNFGVNDLGNISKYISVYKSMPKEFIQKNNVIIMSVNPTDGSKYGSWNTDIDKFNKKMKANLPSGVKYLDTNSTLKKEGFSTRDGVHYKAVTYRRIAQLVFNFCGDKNRKP